MGKTMTCSICGNPAEMYKAQQWLWEGAGLQPNDFACLKCLGDASFQCVVSISDMEPFPWWKDRLDYECGILDGMQDLDSGNQHPEYKIGLQFGAEMKRRSHPFAIAEFIASNRRECSC